MKNRSRCNKFKFAICVSLLLVVACQQPARFEVADTQGMRWFKGNTHTHTTNSDGDSPPEVVVDWYRRHGYNFLVLSDHNVLTDPAAYAAPTDTIFLLIAGEEVSARFNKKPIHVNGLNIAHLVPPQSDSTLVGTIQKNVDAVREARGVPHINHPNFRWAIPAEALLQIRNDRLLEIFNGHPMVNNLGGSGHASLEEIWDQLLTAGQRIYGIAVDDAHHFQREFAPNRSNPGRGWIMVRAHRLEAKEIMANLEAGLFYASTGVELEDVVAHADSMVIKIRQKGDFGYRTAFIGAHGKVLQVSETNPAVYRLRGGERYVRARVTDSGGAVAWVQPVWMQE